MQLYYSPKAHFEEHIRIGGNLEGGAAKSEELVVHQFPSSMPGVC